MRPILLLSLVGALSVPAAAGDISIDFGFRNGHGVSIGFGYTNAHRRAVVVRQKWIPGHYETVSKDVWVPEVREQVWQPAQYGWSRDRCGRRIRVLVRPAGYVTVVHPGRWKCIQETVWVPGHYERC
jgi:hypothetical protein